MLNHHCLLNNQILQTLQNNLTNLNQNSFLQKKRNSDESNNSLENNNSQFNFLEQKRGQNFFKNSPNENKENEIDIEIDSNKIISDTNSNSNISIINNSNLIEKQNKSNNSNNKESNENHIVNNILNTSNVDIIRNNTNENIFKDIFKKQLDNDNKNSKLNPSEYNIIIKNKYFNITNTVSEEKINDNNNNIININKKELSSSAEPENNNEVKVLKNNKAVYVNSCLLNSPSASKNLKKLNKIAFIGRSKRSSKFRGVSKNGNQWQVLLMHKKGKSYVGTYNSEEFAAKIYDILAIKYRGVKARTNFKYSFQQIKKIGETDFDIKSKNLEDIITLLEL